MKRQQLPTRPLVDLAEGRDQDDRSDLYLAYRRCASWRKVTHSNLHVRELLMYVCACDRDGRGVQKSYSEIADRLELKDDQAARYVIARAAKDFRLLLITEARYERGGQTANRYSINWPLVRAIRDGIEDGRPYQAPREPGVTESQAGVTESQAGVTESHPYKEYSRTNTRTNSLHLETTPPPNRHAPSAPPVVPGQKEEELVSDKETFSEEMLGSSGKGSPSSHDSPSRDTCRRNARHHATPTEPTHAALSRTLSRKSQQFSGETLCSSLAGLDCLVSAYVRSGVHSARELIPVLAPIVGVRYLSDLLDYHRAHPEYGPGALYVRLRRSQPDLPIDASWPPAERQTASLAPSRTFTAGDPYAI
jgi:hypothetical protein